MYPGSSAAPSIASRTGTDGINADNKKRRPPGQRFFCFTQTSSLGLEPTPDYRHAQVQQHQV